MLDYLNQLDHRWFIELTTSLRSESINYICTIFRDKFFSVPLYVLIISWLILHYKYWYALIIALMLLVTITDQVSSNLLKKSIKRQRPCNEVIFRDEYSTLINCSGGYSMPSSHATNHSGVAVFLFFVLGCSVAFRWRILLFVWAGMVGFSQVYVGVHFPFDVLVGTFLGGAIGCLYWLIITLKYPEIISLRTKYL